jgi:uncharacterized integral membrane protein
MGQLGVLLALIFSLIIAVLAIANNQPVIINYLYGRAEVSAVVIILGAAVLGALTIFILSLFGKIKGKLQFRNMRNDLKNLKEKLQSLQNERDLLLAQVGRLQETLAEASREVEVPEEKEGISESTAVYREDEEKEDPGGSN